MKTDSCNTGEQLNNSIACDEQSDIKINNLNQLLESECSGNSLTQCADILLAQVVSQSDSQINSMVEDLAAMALRLKNELASV